MRLKQSLPILILIFFFACGEKTAKPHLDKWERVLTDVAKLQSSGGADSTKLRKFAEILQENNITLQEYREFYRTYYEKNPLKSLSLLKTAEGALTQELQTAAKEKEQQEKEEQEEMRRRLQGEQ
ncbi:MAG: hypothetical protein WAN36_05515 [Calditrichia bacterium]